MVCPKCKSEYREGFTRCADCDEPLVEVLPGTVTLSRSPDSWPENEDDPFCELWKGSDGRLKGELCDLLAEARIPFMVLEASRFVLYAGNPIIFRLGVPYSRYESAERVIADAYGGPEAARKILTPREEDNPELQRLAALPWEQKLEGRPEDEVPTFWEQLTWKRKKSGGDS